MQTRSRWYFALLVAAGVALPLATAHAADKYSCTLVQEVNPPNTSDFALLKPGNQITIAPVKPKVVPLPSAPGLVTQLILKNVDCPAEGNDSGKAGKCGIALDPTKCKAAGSPQPCCTGLGTGPTCSKVDAVLAMSVHFAGADIFNVAGVPIEFSKGQAVFQATEKNKIDGSVFGALVTAILGQPMGFHVLTIKTEGSDPTNLTTGCGVVPLPMVNTCLDGIPFAFTGITVGAAM